MRVAICAAIIKNRSLLLVRKENTWILPGGKPEREESDIQCLNREIIEELSGAKPTNFKFYGLFKGITPHQGDTLLAKVYFAEIEGRLKPNAEISKIKWVKGFKNYQLSDITKKVIKDLKRKRYL